MRQHRSPTVAFESAAQARTQDDRSGQCDESANGVDNRRSGKVVEAHAQGWEEVAIAAHQSQPSFRAPRPVSDDWINEAGYRDAIEQVADERGSADHGARRDR